MGAKYTLLKIRGCHGTHGTHANAPSDGWLVGYQGTWHSKFSWMVCIQNYLETTKSTKIVQKLLTEHKEMFQNKKCIKSY